MKTIKLLYQISLLIILTTSNLYAQKHILKKNTKNGKLKATYFDPARGKLYFFDEFNYQRYILNTDKVEYTRKINDKWWKGVPHGTTAVFLHPHNKKAYFFKDDMYYRFDFYKDEVDKKTKINVGWKGVPNNIDAAFNYPAKNVVYFFKGNKYYRFNLATDKVENTGGSLISQNWKGVPDNVDLAFFVHSNGKAYFFKGKYYYRFDFKTDRVDRKATIEGNWGDLSFGYPTKRNTSGFDAAVSNRQHQDVHFFKNDKGFYVKYKRPRVRLLGSLFNIETFWNQSSSVVKVAQLGGPSSYYGVPTHVDAVFCEDSNRYHFFKGSHYYTWDSNTGKVIAKGNIKDNWRRVPNHIDAVANGSEFVYFFKGDRYYKYNLKRKMVDQWSFITSDFKGIPVPVDAARTSESKDEITFYRGNNYFIYSLTNKKVVSKGKIPEKCLKIK